MEIQTYTRVENIHLSLQIIAFQIWLFILFIYGLAKTDGE